MFSCIAQKHEKTANAIEEQNIGMYAKWMSTCNIEELRAMMYPLAWSVS